MRHRLVVVVLVLLVSGCGREGAEQATTVSEPTSTPAKVQGSSRPTSSPGGDATASGRTAAPAASTAGAKRSAAPSSKPATSSAALVRPKAGNYGFHEKGSMRAGSGGQDQPYERDGTLTVSASGVRTTLRYETEQGSEELTLRYETARAFLERARLQQSLATFDARFDPPQLILRSPLKAGDSWSNTWKSDGTSGTTKIRVEREELVRAFGKMWRAFVLTNATTASGDAKGTTKSTSWYVPELGLDVKRVSDFDGTYQGIAVKQHSERILTSRP